MHGDRTPLGRRGRLGGTCRNRAKPACRPRAATIGFVAGLALLVVLAALGIRNAREATDAVAWVERSHRVIESLDEVSARLGEARSTRRAYGLTGDATYRDTFTAEIRAITERIADVRALTADEPTQQQRIAELEPLVADRIARMQLQLAARDSIGKDIPLDDAKSLANGKLDDDIRRHVTDLIDAEHRLLAEREESSSARFRNAEIAATTSAVLAFALLLIAFAVNRREIRQRVRAEAQTRAALVASESVNGELEAFSYSVSHDLRSPLRAIDGFSQAILEENGPRLDDTGKRHLERVRAATQRMGLLIDDLLSLSRVTRSKMVVEDVDLSAIAAATIAELRAANPGRDVRVDIAPQLTTRGDPRLMRILLDNLLGNAFKFTSKRESATIEVGTTVDNGERAFFVRDDGAGFDPRYSDKMFGAFQRLHDTRTFPGNGVGLATAQRILRRHGGKIWATSKPEHGATFFFTLPDVVLPDSVEST